MAPADPQTITRLLLDVRAGRANAARALLDVVHVELRDLVGAIFSSQRGGHTLQPTAVVNEAWLKLVGHLGDAEDRTHFYAIAGRAMRQVLVDHARAARAQKRGAGNERITLDERLGLAARPGDGTLLASAPGDRSVRLWDALPLHERRALEIEVEE